MNLNLIWNLNFELGILKYLMNFMNLIKVLLSELFFYQVNQVFQAEGQKKVHESQK